MSASEERTDRIRVGLVGAGPWAHFRHAPMLSAGPDLCLSGVWARRAEAAAELAAKHNVRSFASFEELLNSSDAVAFSVPPDVQAELAPKAAAAGKALLLEKPLGLDLASAEVLHRAVVAAGVPSQMMFTWRYSASARRLLEEASRSDVIGARGSFILGSLLGGQYATPWRMQQGGYMDLAPHLLDFLDAALGPIVDMQAHGDPRGWTGLLLTHEGGRYSDVSICANVDVTPMVAGVDVFTTRGAISFDANDSNLPENFTAIAADFAQTIRRGDSPLNSARGLYIQGLLDRGARLLTPA